MRPRKTKPVGRASACPIVDKLKHVRPLLANLYDAHNIECTLGDCDVSVASRHHIADDAASRGNCPCLEFLSLGIEADHRVRLHSRFAIPDLPFQESDAIWLRGRTPR